MKMTVRISAGGDRSLTRLPIPRYRMEECLNADGKLDLAKANAAFSGCGELGYAPFTPSSKDDEYVLFALMTFLEQFHDAMRQCVEDPYVNVQDACTSRQDAVLERKMSRGAFVYATVESRRIATGVKLIVRYDNPHGVVGQAEREAREFARTCCQLALRMCDTITWLSLDADEDIVAEAREHNRAAELNRLNAKRLFCERRTTGGFCSPCKFDCPHCKGGKCVEVTA